MELVAKKRALSLQEIEESGPRATQFIGWTLAPHVGVPGFISRPEDRLSRLPLIQMVHGKVKLSPYLNN
jgi:hypothetical protein